MRPELTVDEVAARLHRSRELRDPWWPGPRAAVAAILRFGQGRPEVLLMERAVRKGDRWSGHVSFPGGRAQPGDPSLLATARRETREEVGIALERGGTLLGILPRLLALPQGRLLPMTVTPFVFHHELKGELTLGDEAVETFWLPLDLARDGALDDRHRIRVAGTSLGFACWRFEGHVVWGLTYLMLRRLLALLR